MLLQDDWGRAVAAELAVQPRLWEAGVWMDAGRPDLQGRACGEVRRWRCPLTYVQEQVLIFEIDQLLWPMELGVRRQAWPTSVDPEWTAPLHRAMGAASAAPTLVFELWQARGEVLPGDLQGASALMALGGDAVLRQRDFSLLLPRGTAMRWPRGSPGTSANWYVPR